MLQLIGVVSKSEPLFMLTAHCELGDLKAYLMEQFLAGSALSLDAKLGAACDVANGMYATFTLFLVNFQEAIYS